ncbi:MAG: hypothetical protein ACYTG6_00900 [Planctomycetota bacterium]|jgi:hypothetical protein
MSNELKNRPERDRPEIPESPSLCASCGFGLVIVQKVLLHDRRAGREDAWRGKTAFVWSWESKCTHPRIAGWAPESFFHPVVDCEGFAARDVVVTPEDPEEAQTS